jgi:hypothetical protein
MGRFRQTFDAVLDAAIPEEVGEIGKAWIVDEIVDDRRSGVQLFREIGKALDGPNEDRREIDERLAELNADDGRQTSSLSSAPRPAEADRQG